MGRRTGPLLAISTSVLLCARLLLHAQVAPPKTGRVELSVVDSKTERPVAGAAVELVGPSTYNALSNERGQVGFPRVEPGVYRITLVQVTGYTYEPPDSRSSFAAITVSAGAFVQVGTVVVIPLGTIQGIITDENGDPVSGADVSALRFQYRNGVRTLASVARDTSAGTGQYRIHNVPAGSYYVRVSVPLYRATSVRFAPVYYPNVGAAPQAIRIPVSPGAETPPVDFRLRPTATFHLRGTVSGIPGGNGLNMVAQFCTPGLREDGGTLTAAAVKADGTFDAEAAPPGTYCISLQGRDGVTSSRREVVTVVDRDLENIRLVATPPQDVEGIVRIEGGSSLRMPLAVNLWPAAEALLPLVLGRVDATTGKFHLAGVQPSDYRLDITTGGYIKSIQFGGRDISDGNFNTYGGSGTLVIEIAAGRGRVKGKVDAGFGKPAERMQVTLAPEGALSNRTDLIRTVSTNDSGEFEAGGLAPASYRIFPWEKFEAHLVQFPEFLSQFSVSSVRVADGEVANLEVRMISTREIDDAKARF